MHRMTRRHVLAGLGGLGLLAACGGPTTGAPVDGATRTIQGGFGSADVPVRPQRVVAMYPTGADYALVVGLPLVGSSGARGNAAAAFPPHQPAELLVGVQPLTTFPTPDIEAIAALAPDLIFDDFSVSEQAVYDRLSQIAPVHSFPPFEQSEQLSWRDHLTRTAEVFGATDRARAFVADHDERAAGLRDRIARRWDGATFAYVNPNNETFFVSQLTNQTSTTLSTDLGLTPDPLNPPTYDVMTTYSLEQVGVLTDVDVFVMRVEAASEGAGNDRADLGGLTGTALWTNLPAVRAGNVFEVDAELFYNSPYTALANLDWAEATLLA